MYSPYVLPVCTVLRSSVSFICRWTYHFLGPELAHWKQTGRLNCAMAKDEEALAGQRALNEVESVVAGLDTGHAVGEALNLARQLKPQDNIFLLVTGSDIYPVLNGPKIDQLTDRDPSELSSLMGPEPLFAA